MSGQAAPTGGLTSVVADFFGVLTSPLSEAFAELIERLDLPPQALAGAMEAITEREGHHPLFELECGRMTEGRFHDLLESQLKVDLGRSVGIHRFPELYFELLEPNLELVEHLLGLRNRGYRIACLTNNVLEWGPHWRAMVPVDELFTLVVDSAEVGLRKPDPRIYALTAERLKVPGGEIVFVDDFESNCDAAREQGWTAVRFVQTSQAVAELEEHLAARGVPGAGPA